MMVDGMKECVRCRWVKVMSTGDFLTVLEWNILSTNSNVTWPTQNVKGRQQEGSTWPSDTQEWRTEGYPVAVVAAISELS